MISGLGGRAHGSHNQLHSTLETPNDSIIQEASRIVFGEYELGNLNILDIDNFGNFGKDGAQQLLKIRLRNSWKS